MRKIRNEDFRNTVNCENNSIVICNVEDNAIF